MKRRFYFLGLLVFGALPAIARSLPQQAARDWEQQFLAEHRVFKKVVEGKAEWESFFCRGQYDYRLLLQTQIQELEIDLEEDGSVNLEAKLWEPYIGFQGNYQGAYSFCFPLGAWSGVRAKDATIRAKIEFFEKEEGRVEVSIRIDSVELGVLMTNALAPSLEKQITDTLNQGLREIWASELGDWAEQWISYILNKNIPIHL